jgi:hypothetical protein
MRASLYLVGFAVAAMAGAGVTEVGCSSSSSNPTTPVEDAATPGPDSTAPEDTGTGMDAAAAPCTPVDANAATIMTGSAVWNCYEAMCTTSLTACAANCACNTGVIEALLCAADAGPSGSTTCFGMVTGVTTSPNSDLTTCLVKNAACMSAGMGDGGGTEGGTTAEAGPADAGGGG